MKGGGVNNSFSFHQQDQIFEIERLKNICFPKTPYRQISGTSNNAYQAQYSPGSQGADRMNRTQIYEDRRQLSIDRDQNYADDSSFDAGANKKGYSSNINQFQSQAQRGPKQKQSNQGNNINSILKNITAAQINNQSSNSIILTQTSPSQSVIFNDDLFFKGSSDQFYQQTISSSFNSKNYNNNNVTNNEFSTINYNNNTNSSFCVNPNTPSQKQQNQITYGFGQRQRTLSQGIQGSDSQNLLQSAQKDVGLGGVGSGQSVNQITPDVIIRESMVFIARMSKDLNDLCLTQNSEKSLGNMVEKYISEIQRVQKLWNTSLQEKEPNVNLFLNMTNKCLEDMVQKMGELITRLRLFNKRKFKSLVEQSLTNTFTEIIEENNQLNLFEIVININTYLNQEKKSLNTIRMMIALDKLKQRKLWEGLFKIKETIVSKTIDQGKKENLQLLILNKYIARKCGLTGKNVAKFFYRWSYFKEEKKQVENRIVCGYSNLINYTERKALGGQKQILQIFLKQQTKCEKINRATEMILRWEQSVQRSRLVDLFTRLKFFSATGRFLRSAQYLAPQLKRLDSFILELKTRHLSSSFRNIENYVHSVIQKQRAIKQLSSLNRKFTEHNLFLTLSTFNKAVRFNSSNFQMGALQIQRLLSQHLANRKRAGFTQITKFFVFNNSQNKKNFKSLKQSLKSIKVRNLLDYLREVTLVLSNKKTNQMLSSLQVDLGVINDQNFSMIQYNTEDKRIQLIMMNPEQRGTISAKKRVDDESEVYIINTPIFNNQMQQNEKLETCDIFLYQLRISEGPHSGNQFILIQIPYSQEPNQFVKGKVLTTIENITANFSSLGQTNTFVLRNLFKNSQKNTNFCLIAAFQQWRYMNQKKFAAQVNEQNHLIEIQQSELERAINQYKHETDNLMNEISFKNQGILQIEKQLEDINIESKARVKCLATSLISNTILKKSNQISAIKRAFSNWNSFVHEKRLAQTAYDHISQSNNKHLEVRYNTSIYLLSNFIRKYQRSLRVHGMQVLAYNSVCQNNTAIVLDTSANLNLNSSATKALKNMILQSSAKKRLNKSPNASNNQINNSSSNNLLALGSKSPISMIVTNEYSPTKSSKQTLSSKQNLQNYDLFFNNNNNNINNNNNNENKNKSPISKTNYTQESSNANLLSLNNKDQYSSNNTMLIQEYHVSGEDEENFGKKDSDAFQNYSSQKEILGAQKSREASPMSYETPLTSPLHNDTLTSSLLNDIQNQRFNVENSNQQRRDTTPTGNKYSVPNSNSSISQFHPPNLGTNNSQKNSSQNFNPNNNFNNSIGSNNNRFLISGSQNGSSQAPLGYLQNNGNNGNYFTNSGQFDNPNNNFYSHFGGMPENGEKSDGDHNNNNNNNNNYYSYSNNKAHPNYNNYNSLQELNHHHQQQQLQQQQQQQQKSQTRYLISHTPNTNSHQSDLNNYNSFSTEESQPPVQLQPVQITNPHTLTTTRSGGDMSSTPSYKTLSNTQILNSYNQQGNQMSGGVGINPNNNNHNRSFSHTNTFNQTANKSGQSHKQNYSVSYQNKDETLQSLSETYNNSSNFLTQENQSLMGTGQPMSSANNSGYTSNLGYRLSAKTINFLQQFSNEMNTSSLIQSPINAGTSKSQIHSRNQSAFDGNSNYHNVSLEDSVNAHHSTSLIRQYKNK